MIKLFNTASSKKELFTPSNPPLVTMYNCGPTVYQEVHIGNLRSYVFADVLRRVLEYNNLQVKQVINITDIGHLTSDADEGDDKMSLALKKAGKPLTLEALNELANFYTNKFIENLKQLNIDVSKIKFPRASQTITEQIALISELEKKGLTYKTSDGLYFDTSKFSEYGKLGNIKDQTDNQSRIGINSEKHTFRDFALWKFNSELGWQSPWGKGFPGWHIECSAMSMAFLAHTIDIHTGGIDHIAVHHNNEIAQSEAATGVQFVRYWLHNAFVTIKGERLAKSKGEATRLVDLENMGVSALGYRYWLLTGHYRTPLDFTVEAVKGSQQAYNRLIEQYQILLGQSQHNQIASDQIHQNLIQKYRDLFTASINDDLNTAEALATTWNILKDKDINPKEKIFLLNDFDRVFGLQIQEQAKQIEKKEKAKENFEIPESIKKHVEQREQARKDKDWQKADQIRKEIESFGFSVTDGENGSIIKKL